MPEKTFWQKVKVIFGNSWVFIRGKIWPIVKALPAILLKTKAGRAVLGMIILSILKKFIPGLTFEMVESFLDLISEGILDAETIASLAIFAVGTYGTLYGNESKKHVKDLVAHNEKHGMFKTLKKKG